LPPCSRILTARTGKKSVRHRHHREKNLPRITPGIKKKPEGLNDGDIEELLSSGDYRAERGNSLFSRPFNFYPDNDPEVLFAESDGLLAEAEPLEEEPSNEILNDFDGKVIQEKDGVHYINAGVFTPDKNTEAALDQDLKNLVDSIIR
jgi:hypothetical protein